MKNVSVQTKAFDITLGLYIDGDADVVLNGYKIWNSTFETYDYVLEGWEIKHPNKDKIQKMDQDFIALMFSDILDDTLEDLKKLDQKQNEDVQPDWVKEA